MNYNSIYLELDTYYYILLVYHICSLPVVCCIRVPLPIYKSWAHYMEHICLDYLCSLNKLFQEVLVEEIEKLKLVNTIWNKKLQLFVRSKAPPWIFLSVCLQRLFWGKIAWLKLVVTIWKRNMQLFFSCNASLWILLYVCLHVRQ